MAYPPSCMGEGDTCDPRASGSRGLIRVQPMSGAACLDKLDEISWSAPCDLVAKHATMFDILPDIERGIECHHAENRRGAAQVYCPISPAAVVLRGELERVAYDQTSRSAAVRKVAMVAWRDIEKSRCARAAIQIFVTATDGEIRRCTAGKVDPHRAGRMRKIPDHKRAGIMCSTGQCRHVMHCCRSR